MAGESRGGGQGAGGRDGGGGEGGRSNAISRLFSLQLMSQ